MISNELPNGTTEQDRLSRRDFLGTVGKTSVLATATLYSASSLAVLTSTRSGWAAEPQFLILRDADIKLFGALLPAVVQQANPKVDSQKFLQSLDSILAHADAETAQLIQQLVDLVTGALTRGAMTGSLFWDWPDFDVQTVNSILESWRESYFELPKTVYAVVTRLTATAWYMVPENQQITGYKGPPKKIVD